MFAKLKQKTIEDSSPSRPQTNKSKTSDVSSTPKESREETVLKNGGETVSTNELNPQHSDLQTISSPEPKLSSTDKNEISDQSKTDVSQSSPHPSPVQTVVTDKETSDTIKTTPTPNVPSTPTRKSRIGSVTKEDGGLILDKMSREEITELCMKQRQVALRYKGRFTEVMEAHKKLEAINQEKEANLTAIEKKYMRKLSEMKEAQELDRQAKGHMEETFRLALDEKDEKITVLQTQVRLLKEKVAQDKEKEVQERAAEMEELKTKLSNYESQVNKYQDNLHLAREKISQLRKDKELLKEEIKKAAVVDEDDKTKVTEQDAVIASLREELEQLKQDKERIVSSKEEEYKKDVQAKESEIEKLAEALQKQQESISSDTAQYQDEMDGLQTQNEEFKTIVKEQTVEVEKLRSQLVGKENELSGLLKRIEEGEHIRRGYEEERQQRRELDTNTANEIDQLKSVIEEQERLISQQDMNCKDLHGRVEQFEEQHGSIVKELTVGKETVKRLEVELTKCGEERNELIEIVDTLKNDLTSVNEELVISKKSYEQVVMEFERRLKLLQEDLTQQTEMVRTLQEGKRNQELLGKAEKEEALKVLRLKAKDQIASAKKAGETAAQELKNSHQKEMESLIARQQEEMTDKQTKFNQELTRITEIHQRESETLKNEMETKLQQVQTSFEKYQEDSCATIEEKDKTIVETVEQLEKIKECHCMELKKKTNELEDLHSKSLKELEQRMKDSHNVKMEECSDTHKKEISELKDKLTVSVKQCQEQEDSRISTLRKTFEDKELELTSKCQDLTIKLREMEDEKLQLVSEYQQLQKLHESTVVTHKAEMDALNSGKENQVTRLTEDLADQLKSLQQERSHLTVELESIKRANANLVKENEDKQQSYSQEVVSLTKEKEVLSNVNTSLEDKINEMNDIVEQKTQSCQDYESNISKTKLELKSLIETSSKERERLKSELDQLTNKYQDLENDYSKMSELTETKNKQNVQLLSNVDQLQKQCMELKRELDENTKSLSAEQEEMKMQGEKREKELSDTSAEKAQQIESLRIELVASKDTHNEEMTETNKKLGNVNALLEQSLAREKVLKEEVNRRKDDQEVAVCTVTKEKDIELTKLKEMHDKRMLELTEELNLTRQALSQESDEKVMKLSASLTKLQSENDQKCKDLETLHETSTAEIEQMKLEHKEKENNLLENHKQELEAAKQSTVSLRTKFNEKLSQLKKKQENLAMEMEKKMKDLEACLEKEKTDKRIISEEKDRIMIEMKNEIETYQKEATDKLTLLDKKHKEQVQAVVEEKEAIIADMRNQKQEEMLKTDSSWKTRVKTLEVELEEKKSELVRISAEAAKLKERHVVVSSELNETKKRKEEENGLVDKLGDRVELLEKQVQTSKCNVEQLEGIVSLKTTELAEKEKEIEKSIAVVKTDSHSSFQSKLEEQRLEIKKKAETKLATMKKQYTEQLAKSNNEHAAILRSKDEEINRLTSSRDELSRNRMDLEKQVSVLESEIAAATKQGNVRYEESTKLQSELAERRSSAAEVTKERDESMQRELVLKDDLKVTKQMLESTQGQLDQLVKEKDAIETQFTTESVALKSDKEKLEKTLEEMENNHSAQVKSLEKKVKQSERRIGRVEEEWQAKTQEIITSSTEDREKWLAEMSEKMTKKIEEIQNGCTSHIDDLQTKCSNLEKELVSSEKERENERKANATRTSELEATVLAMKERHEKYVSQIKQQNELQVSSLENDYKQQIVNLKLKNESQSKELASVVQQNVTRIKSQLSSENQTLIKQYEEQIRSLQDDKQQEIIQYNKQLTSSKAELQEAKDGLLSEQERIRKLEEHMLELQRSHDSELEVVRQSVRTELEETQQTSNGPGLEERLKADMEAKYQEQLSQLQETVSQFEEKHINVARLENMVKDYKQALKVKETEKSKLKEEIDRLRLPSRSPPPTIIKSSLTSKSLPVHPSGSNVTSKNMKLEHEPHGPEFEYFKNVLFEYMMGRQRQQLTKVIAVLARFSERQKTELFSRGPY